MKGIREIRNTKTIKLLHEYGGAAYNPVLVCFFFFYYGGEAWTLTIESWVISKTLIHRSR